MNHVEEILKKVHEVKPFPKVTHKLMEMLRDPNVQVSDLARVIQYDEVLSAHIFKMCNTAYYGLARKITSINDALVMIGHDALKDIIMVSGSSQYLKGKVGTGYDLEEGELWKHSIAVASMAKLLVQHIPGVDLSTAFTAGLLHDIGKRFLSAYVAQYFEKIMDKVLGRSSSFIAAEKEFLGMTHAELGGLLLREWEFDEELQEAVRHHHDADALDREPLTAVVALSNALVISMGIGVGADGLSTEMRGAGLARFKISQSMLELCMVNLVDDMEKAEELLRA